MPRSSMRVTLDDACAAFGSIDRLIHKAFTSRAFDMKTQDVATTAQPSQTPFAINWTNCKNSCDFLRRYARKEG
jgi:hypothetical protein